MVAVGFHDRAFLQSIFRDVRLARRLPSHPTVVPTERGAPVWIARDPVDSWDRLWPRFKHYDDAGADA